MINALRAQRGAKTGLLGAVAPHWGVGYVGHRPNWTHFLFSLFGKLLGFLSGTLGRIAWSRSFLHCFVGVLVGLATREQEHCCQSDGSQNEHQPIDPEQ